jgi:hypothetical protein
LLDLPDMIISIAATPTENLVNVNTMDGRTTAVEGDVDTLAVFLINFKGSVPDQPSG